MTASRPARSEVVEEIVCTASVRFKPEPPTLPMGSSGTVQGSSAVPLPVTAMVLDPNNPARCPSHAVIGGAPGGVSNEANQ
jgi:hypothetical protein